MKLIFLGSPAVGKGTYASKIKIKLNIPHISTGDLLREEVKAESKLGKEAKSYMDSGGLVPDELVLTLFKQRIEKDDCKNGFILDGFPRNIKQADKLTEIIDIDKVIYFHAAKETIISRISGRRTCQKCGRIFHITNIPPKVEGICDFCGGDLIQRSDEKPDVVEQRLQVYDKNTKPLIDYYQKKGELITIEAEGKVEGIVNETIAKLKIDS